MRLIKFGIIGLLYLILIYNVEAANQYKTRQNPFTGKPDYVLGTDSLEVGDVTATGTVSGIDVQATTFSVGNTAQANLTVDGSGNLTFFDFVTGYRTLAQIVSGTFAPVNADYLVGTSNSSLTNEIVVGTTPGGDLSNTWASPQVTDDSHAHTGSTLSSIDISSDTNLSGDTENVLTGDALSISAGITRDTEWDSIAEINTASTDADILIFQNIAVTGQTTVATDAIADTLTLAGGGITAITTNATSDTITFTSTEADTLQNVLQRNPFTDQPLITTNTMEAANANVTDTVSGIDVQSTGTVSGVNVNVSGSERLTYLSASKPVFTDAEKVLTSGGIGTSSQFIKGDGSLDSSTYLTSAANTALSNISATNLGAALNTTSGNLTIQTTTSGHIILSPVGNVGIGTTGPGYKLEVNGTFQADDFYAGDGTQGGTATTGGLTFTDGLYISGTASSGATTALDNLASVAVNTSIISDTDSTDDLGSSTKSWSNVWADNFKQGTATALIIDNDGSNQDIIMKTNDGGVEETVFQADGATGIVTMAQQPYARAYIASGTQSINDQTWTKVTLNAENSDTQGEFDSTTNYRYTATKGGTYVIYGRNQYSAGAVVADKVYRVGFYKNAELYTNAAFHASVGAQMDATQTVIITLAANDYIEQYAYHNAGAGPTLDSASTATYFEIGKMN